jgi:hypothetical protein
VRDKIWADVVGSQPKGMTRAINHPTAIARTMPDNAITAQRIALSPDPMTNATTIPMIGVIRGAIIIAPIIDATESLSSPQVAMTDAKMMSMAKRVSRARISGGSKKSVFSIRTISSCFIPSLASM